MADASESTNEPIHECIERWHRHLRGELPGGLDELLHEDCVFLSPIVFTPQRGREITKMYLRAAGGTLADADPDAGSAPIESSSGKFRYVKEIRQGHHAMLEFETTIAVDGEQKYANGVDIISCDDDGMIVEFKVMMRPLQAIHAVHAQMAAMLEQLAES
jgi:hypothetical protein